MKRLFLATALVSAILFASVFNFGCSSSTSDVAPVFDQTGTLVGFLLVANRTDGTISSFIVNTGTGELTAATGSPFGGGSTSINQLVLGPNSSFVYGSSVGSSLIYAFSFNSGTGALTALGNTATIAGDFGAVIDRSGRYLYIIGTTQIDGFAINANTGALTQLGGFPMNTGTTSGRLGVFDASNQFLYVTDTGANQIRGYGLNSTTGALTELGLSPYATGGNGSYAIGIDPSNRFLYVSDSGTPQAWGFTIAANGDLTAIGGFPQALAGATGDGSGVAFLNQTVLFSSTGNLNSFTINQTTGAFTGAAAGFPFATGGTFDAVLSIFPNLPFIYIGDWQGARVLGVSLNGPAAVTNSPFAVGNNPFGVLPVAFVR